MDNKAWHNQWLNVDATSDPGFFVEFLDQSRVGTLRMIEANPAAYFAYLNPRPGMRVLDVGTGVGNLIHRLAELVGTDGIVTGLDSSTVMIEEASRRAPQGLPLEYHVGDAYAMEFPDDTFDVAMSHVVFQHLPQPEKPLREMIRVTKPGGLVVLTEQDWDTLFIDGGDLSVNRRIVHAFADMLPNGNIGRQLPRMFAELGLTEITAAPSPLVLTGPAARFFDSMIEGHLGYCLANGIVTQAEHREWLSTYRQRANDGTLTVGFLSIRTSGKKPNHSQA
jgi:ubiquinone/menaquinone biosynthesis C-methylase UbiE